MVHQWWWWLIHERKYDIWGRHKGTGVCAGRRPRLAFHGGVHKNITVDRMLMEVEGKSPWWFHRSSRLWAVSLLLENPYGKWAWRHAWHTSCEWRSREPRVAWASEDEWKDRLHWFHTTIWMLLWQVASFTLWHLHPVLNMILRCQINFSRETKFSFARCDE